MKLNIIKICDKCKGTNINTLLPKLKQLKNISIEIGCQNLCGIGRTKSFCILNNIPIIADNEEDLLYKIKEKLI